MTIRHASGEEYQRFLAHHAPKASGRAKRMVAMLGQTQRGLWTYTRGTGLLPTVHDWPRVRHSQSLRALRRYVRELGGSTAAFSRRVRRLHAAHLNTEDGQAAHKEALGSILWDLHQLELRTGGRSG